MTKSPKKKKKSDITRDALLDSAKELFRQKSYDQVGVREISSKVGVDASLVYRYFGSKKQLFAELFAEDLGNYDALYEVPASQLGERLAEFVIKGEIQTQAGELLTIRTDKLLTILQSVGCQDALPLLREVIAEHMTSPLLEALGDEERAVEKAALIVSTLFGFTLVHRMIGTACFMRADGDILLQLLSQKIQMIIDS